MTAQDDDVVVAILGGTGVGKSSFIASVTGRDDVRVGHDLASETSDVQPYRFSYCSRSYVLVDTPGFDDSRMSNDEITGKILQWLEATYRNGTRLSGIIYIHDIRKPRVQGSAYKNMRLFSKLCGGNALENVVLATSFWDQIAEPVGAQREHELRTSTDFWTGMVAKGAEVVRLDGGRADRLEILERIAARTKQGLEAVGQNAISFASEIREFEETMGRERKAARERLQRKLERGQKIHEENMEQLRIHRAQSQREAEQNQRRVEKEHKRQVREDRRQMKQQRREVEGSLLQMEGKQRWYRELQILTAFWLLLATSLIGNVMADSVGGTPASINFAMFSIVWSWLTVLVGIGSYSVASFPLIIVLFWDILATIFVFSTAADLAGRLGVNNCAENDYLDRTNIIVGSADSTKRCRELQASVAFLWFIFTCLATTSVLDIRRAWKLDVLGSEIRRIGSIATSRV